jgi:hypothetical protein
LSTKTLDGTIFRRLESLCFASKFDFLACGSHSISITMLSQPHFEASVRMRLTLLKVGTRSPPGLLQFQSSIVEVKTPRLEIFFISLERPWNLDVENGLAWAIWTFVAQVMVERTVGSQIGNLTPDHKKSGIDSILVCAERVRHTVEKFLRRATSLL